MGFFCGYFAYVQVATALGNPLAIGDDFELTNLVQSKDGVNSEGLLNEGHETCDLGLSVVSCRAVNDLEPSWVLQSRSFSQLALIERLVMVNDNVRILYDGS